MRRVGVAYIKQSNEAFAVAAAEVSDGGLSRIFGGHEACVEIENVEGGLWME